MSQEQNTAENKPTLAWQAVNGFDHPFREAWRVEAHDRQGRPVLVAPVADAAALPPLREAGAPRILFDVEHPEEPLPLRLVLPKQSPVRVGALEQPRAEVLIEKDVLDRYVARRLAVDGQPLRRRRTPPVGSHRHHGPLFGNATGRDPAPSGECFAFGDMFCDDEADPEDAAGFLDDDSRDEEDEGPVLSDDEEFAEHFGCSREEFDNFVSDHGARWLRKRLRELGHPLPKTEEAKHICRPIISPMPKWPTSGGVYFVAAGNRIKIGKAQNVDKRLRELQTSAPYKLDLMAVAPGGLAEESLAHRRFHEFRLHGEWFSWAPQIVEYMAALRSDEPVASTPATSAARSA